ncbi:MAG: hypothetical protein DRR04_10300 [Gammaproteobacteria bacterium]|nr:MAG: hypothetical protein DRR04_10300 [Gammaproteobacteria bacterium]
MTWLSTVRDRYSVATNPLRTERKIELFALLLGLVLCFQLLYSGVRYARAPVFDAVAPAEDALTVKQIHPLARVSTVQSEQIRARPLFWESRRPVEGVVETAKTRTPHAKDAKLKNVTLLGVFSGDETAGIIVKVKGKKRRILLGEEIDGWTLESVEPNEIVFSAGGRTKKLQLQARSDFGDMLPAAKKSVKESSEESLSLGGMLRK